MIKLRDERYIEGEEDRDKNKEEQGQDGREEWREGRRGEHMHVTIIKEIDGFMPIIIFKLVRTAIKINPGARKDFSDSVL